MATALRLSGLKLIDMPDRELLALINQEGDNDGWVFANHMVDVLGLPRTNGGEQKRHPTTMVSSRFSWMVRYGALESNGDKPEGTRWRLTDKGRLIVRNKLTATQLKSLEKMRPDQLLHITDYVSNVYQAVDDTGAHLVRRQMQYAVLRRRGRGY